MKARIVASARARILELRAHGCPDRGGRNSYRAISETLEAEGHEVSHESVRAVIQEAEARGWSIDAQVHGKQAHDDEGAPTVPPRLVQVRGTGKAQGGGRPVQGTGTGAGTPAGEPGEQHEDDDGEAVELPPLPDDATVAARVLYRDIKDSDRRLRELPSGADYASEYSSIARVKMQQVGKLAALIPPSKPDPKHDPTNLAARELIRERCVDKVNGVLERARRAGFRVPEEL